MPPITVAALRHELSSSRLKAGITGSNPIQGMDICVRLFCVCAILCVGSGLTMG
jgi:hypothetical protein